MCLWRRPVSEREERAAWVRQNLPTCAAFAAQVAAGFKDARMTYASENGHVIGKPADVPEIAVSGDALMESLRTKAKGKK